LRALCQTRPHRSNEKDFGPWMCRIDGHIGQTLWVLVLANIADRGFGNATVAPAEAGAYHAARGKRRNQYLETP